MLCTRYSCRVLIKLELVRHIFEICSRIKFLENLCGGNRCSVRRDITKLIVAFLNFTIALKKRHQKCLGKEHMMMCIVEQVDVGVTL